MLNTLLTASTALTVILAITALLVKAAQRPCWRCIARQAFHCALVALSTSIATQNMPVTLAAIAYCILAPYPAVSDAR